MYKNDSENNDVYLVAHVNEKGEVINFPMGGGSSTKPSLKAHTNFKSAKRSQRHFEGSVIVKATGYQSVDK